MRVSIQGAVAIMLLVGVPAVASGARSKRTYQRRASVQAVIAARKSSIRVVQRRPIAALAKRSTPPMVNTGSAVRAVAAGRATATPLRIAGFEATKPMRYGLFGMTVPHSGQVVLTLEGAPAVLERFKSEFGFWMRTSSYDRHASGVPTSWRIHGNKMTVAFEEVIVPDILKRTVDRAFAYTNESLTLAK